LLKRLVMLVKQASNSSRS